MLRKLPKRPGWWKPFVRRNTKYYIGGEMVAGKWKKRLSLVYMFTAWNALAVVIYMMWTGRTDWTLYYGYKSEEEANMPPGKAWANSLQIEKAKIIRVRGLSKLSEYDFELHSNEENVEKKEE